MLWVFKRTKEPSQRDGSFEYPQHMLWLRNKISYCFGHEDICFGFSYLYHVALVMRISVLDHIALVMRISVLDHIALVMRISVLASVICIILLRP